MPQLDSLNYLNQLLGLCLYLCLFYYTTLKYLLPHWVALFKVNEWVLHKIAAYTFNLQQEKLDCLIFLKPEWFLFIQHIQKSLTDSQHIFNQLAATEQYLLLDVLHELIVENSDAPI